MGLFLEPPGEHCNRNWVGEKKQWRTFSKPAFNEDILVLTKLIIHYIYNNKRREKSMS